MLWAGRVAVNELSLTAIAPSAETLAVAVVRYGVSEVTVWFRIWIGRLTLDVVELIATMT